MPGLVRNKKLEERIKKEKEEAAHSAAPVDPKAKGKPGAPPAKAPEAKKPEPAGK